MRKVQRLIKCANPLCDHMVRPAAEYSRLNFSKYCRKCLEFEMQKKYVKQEPSNFAKNEVKKKLNKKKENIEVLNLITKLKTRC